jgi:hypothetical protein
MNMRIWLAQLRIFTIFLPSKYLREKQVAAWIEIPAAHPAEGTNAALGNSRMSDY